MRLPVVPRGAEDLGGEGMTQSPLFPGLRHRLIKSRIQRKLDLATQVVYDKETAARNYANFMMLVQRKAEMEYWVSFAQYQGEHGESYLPSNAMIIEVERIQKWATKMDVSTLELYAGLVWRPYMNGEDAIPGAKA
jgi:hypothetical protein